MKWVRVMMTQIPHVGTLLVAAEGLRKQILGASSRPKSLL